MAFWGVEVTPTRRHLHRFNPTLGRLHISQATLGNGNGSSKSVLQCNVGDKAPILLCCLTPQKTECCCLNLEFEEDGADVIFSVVGPTSVHLAGYYLPRPRIITDADDGDDTDSHGEDIADTDPEYSHDDDDDDTYDTGDGFIDDRDILETYSSSPSPSPSPVMIKKSNARPKRLKKKFQVSDSDGDAHKPTILGGTASIFDSDTNTDDQDSLPISSLSNTKYTSPRNPKKSDKKMLTNKDDDGGGGGQVIGSKRKCQHSPDGDTERGIEVPNESSVPFSEVGMEISEKRKKKKKKGHTKEVKISGVVDGSMIDVHVEETTQKQDDITLVEPVSDERCSDDKEVEKANKSGLLSSAENEPKKKRKKKRANEEKTQAGVTDDKAQMQEAHLVGITNDDHVIDADAAAGGKKKKKKNKKKAGDEPRKETDKGGNEG